MYDPIGPLRALKRFSIKIFPLEKLMYFILLKRLIGSTFFLYLRVFDRSLVFASVTSPHAFAHLRWMCPRGGLHFRKNEVEVLGGGGRRKGNCKKSERSLVELLG